MVETFSEEQKQLLLKFVTSCRRPPLLGFASMYPKFCIHPAAGGDEAGGNERLPTSSTCMNLLKLPVFGDVDTLREKLLLALSNSSGFALS